MKAVLKMEFIGDNWIQHRRLRQQNKIKFKNIRTEINSIRYGNRYLHPWVAKITGLSDKFGLAREFISVFRDYSKTIGAA